MGEIERPLATASPLQRFTVRRQTLGMGGSAGAVGRRRLRPPGGGRPNDVIGQTSRRASGWFLQPHEACSFVVLAVCRLGGCRYHGESLLAPSSRI